MITKLKETLGIIKANPIKCGFIILITIYLLTLCLNFDIADWLNLTAKTSDKCNYLAKEQLIIKTQNINKSQNLTTIIDINNNCNSLDAEKQIIAKRDLTKLQDYIAIFATFFVAIAIFIIDNQNHQLKSLDKIIIDRFFRLFAIGAFFSLILFLLLFYRGNSIYWSNLIILIFIFYAPLSLLYLRSFDRRTGNQTNTISDLKTPEEVDKVWKELLQPETINKLSNQEIDSLLQNSFVKHCKILDLYYKDDSQKRRLRSFLINDKVMNCLIDYHPNFVAIMNFYENENEKNTYFKDHYQELFNAAFAKNEQKSLNLLRAFRGWLEEKKKVKFPLEVSEYYFDKLLKIFDKLEKYVLDFMPRINDGGIYFLSITKSLKTRLWLDIANQDYDYKNFIPKLKFFCEDSAFLMLKILISSYKHQNLLYQEDKGKSFNYFNEDDSIKYKKFFMIFYEVFEYYYRKNTNYSIAYMGEHTKEEIEEMFLKKQDSIKKEEKALIKRIPTEIIDKILDNLIFFNLVKDFFNWQKSLLEKEEQPNNYALYEKLEHTLEDRKYPKYSDTIKQIYHRICCLGLSYDSENYKQKIFIKHFEDYSNKIFDYCSEIYKEEKAEYKKIYNEYKNILFPPQS